MDESGLKVSSNCADRSQIHMLMSGGGRDTGLEFPEEILGGGTITNVNMDNSNAEDVNKSVAGMMGGRQVEDGYSEIPVRNDLKGGIDRSHATASMGVDVGRSASTSRGDGANVNVDANADASVNVDANANANANFNRLSHANFSMFPSYMQAHSLMDPSIQESLSPFFQPFGVDVSHFPMTNPPIFQSSLASDSPNPRRRRISISNGQIGQLGEDEDVVDSIYHSQPPPMPPQRVYPLNNNVTGRNTHPSQVVKLEPGERTLPLGHTTETFSERPSFEELQSQSNVPDNFLDPAPKSKSSHTQVNNSDVISKQKSDQSSVKSSSSLYSERQTLPGTAAWKKARLLERNRIAASKCRQRKKIAHEQLQKDVTLLTNSNRIMKTKLDYYQKLVTKFKKFMELHMKSCGGSSDGLTMIEEMLRIDHDLQQDEQGNLIEKDKN